MERKLHFAPLEAHLDVPQAVAQFAWDVAPSQEVVSWADYAAELIDTLPYGVVFGIGKLRKSLEDSRSLAHSIARVVCEALQRRGAPDTMFVELDRTRIPIIIGENQVRTLLPHNDGAHCSYITPSLEDDPTWSPAFRRFSSEGFSTTQMHKLYQGIFVAETGEGLSVTTYYDLLKILQRAYLVSHGVPAHSIERLSAWVGENIRASSEGRAEHKGRYLTLGALLGSRRLVYQAISLHLAEDGFTEQEILRYPELGKFIDESTIQREFSPIECLLNQELLDTLHLTWQEFRHHYEVCVPNERFDFVLAHNLALVHGGLMGGSQRRLEPVCLVVEQPSGEKYEHWLARAWRRLPLLKSDELAE